jgi:hypothetical protein
MGNNIYMLCVGLIGSIACGAFIGLIWGAIGIGEDGKLSPVNRFNWRTAFLFGGTTFAACFGAVWWLLK